MTLLQSEISYTRLQQRLNQTIGRQMLQIAQSSRILMYRLCFWRSRGGQKAIHENSYIPFENYNHVSHSHSYIILVAGVLGDNRSATLAKG